ncbi:hypothetical protein KSP40_PGU008428 [Platanthera guangdongensis]|uniref:Uncharacterized protein n=1 Tax=Platanthera guangdongensis TaxID=2320717 RepID=A0ABR2LIM7_9ASPA
MKCIGCCTKQIGEFGPEPDLVYSGERLRSPLGCLGTFSAKKKNRREERRSQEGTSAALRLCTPAAGDSTFRLCTPTASRSAPLHASRWLPWRRNHEGDSRRPYSAVGEHLVCCLLSPSHLQSFPAQESWRSPFVQIKRRHWNLLIPSIILSSDSLETEPYLLYSGERLRSPLDCLGTFSAKKKNRREERRSQEGTSAALRLCTPAAGDSTFRLYTPTASRSAPLHASRWLPWRRNHEGDSRRPYSAVGEHLVCCLLSPSHLQSFPAQESWR